MRIDANTTAISRLWRALHLSYDCVMLLTAFVSRCLPRDVRVTPLLALLLVLTGCAGKKQPPQVSTEWARVRQGVYAGSPLEGAQSVPAGLGAAGAVGVEMRLVALEKDPGEVLEPLATKARVLANTQGENPFLATATLTLPARYGSGPEAEGLEAAVRSGAWGSNATVGEFSAAVPVGATGWLQVMRGEAVTRDRVRVAVYRVKGDDEAVQLALLVEHPDATPPLEGAKSGKPAARLARETALVRQKVENGSQAVALLLPLAVSEGHSQSLLAIVRISPLGADEEAKVAKSLGLMRSAAEAAARERAVAGPDALDPALIASVVEAITLGEQRRSALVYFAGQTKAPLGEQVAMVAEEDVLDELSLQLADELGKQQGLWKREDAGWLLDRLAFQRLAQGYLKRRLTPELRGVLAAYAGEAGRSPAALEQILDALSTRKDFENRLLAENLIALEDNSPSARVRAYDWLKARGRAPQGYDPLGESKARREAMERVMETLANTQENNEGKNEVKP